jgi:hypothetical protein
MSPAPLFKANEKLTFRCEPQVVLSDDDPPALHLDSQLSERLFDLRHHPFELLYPLSYLSSGEPSVEHHLDCAKCDQALEVKAEKPSFFLNVADESDAIPISDLALGYAHNRGYLSLVVNVFHFESSSNTGGLKALSSLIPGDHLTGQQSSNNRTSPLPTPASQAIFDTTGGFSSG